MEKLFDLTGKVAILTGAAGYFGSAFCDALLHQGCRVVLLGRGNKMKELESKLAAKYDKTLVTYYDVDFYQYDIFEEVLKHICNSEKTIDILINNAYEFGNSTGFGKDGRLNTIPKEKFMKSLESGVYWPLFATQIVGEKMKLQKSGSIINISSMYGIVSPSPHLYEGTTSFNPPSYGAAKAALIHLTKYTATWLGEHNIRCNAIAPGAFPNLDSLTNKPDPRILNKLNRRTVLGRTGHPDELKGVVIFLASDASSYVTGETISVDGGWITT